MQHLREIIITTRMEHVRIGKVIVTEEQYVKLNKITFCNICGNNYYDPNGACSHWDGQIYGNTICATTEKMFWVCVKMEYDKCLAHKR